MNYWQAVRIITSWEFRRFLKVRDLIVAVLMTAFFGTAVPLAMDYFGSRDAGQLTLAQTGGQTMPESERFTFVQMDQAEAEAALLEGEVSGVLNASNPEAPVILLEQERVWTAELNAVLVQAALDERLQVAGVTADEFLTLTAPVELDVQLTEAAPASGTTVIVIVAGAMIFAVFTGTGLLFSAITGEKTQRVTEQIISAVHPQAWIDGKVLGTGLFVLVNMGSLVVGIILAVLAQALISGNGVPPLPEATSINPGVLLTALLFAILGGALYFMLFAAVAATIDDPATSQRSGLIMLPGLFVGLSFLGLIGSVDNFLFRFLSYFPLTSPTAMPIRLMLGDAGWLEVLLSAALLGATVYLARAAAGRIFALGILMTGKEPSWREMLHWVRRT